MLLTEEQTIELQKELKDVRENIKQLTKDKVDFMNGYAERGVEITKLKEEKEFHIKELKCLGNSFSRLKKKLEESK